MKKRTCSNEAISFLFFVRMHSRNAGCLCCGAAVRPGPAQRRHVLIGVPLQGRGAIDGFLFDTTLGFEGAPGTSPDRKSVV